MIIDCIADLHGHYPVLEGGDLLIIAGDIAANYSFGGWDDFLFWAISQKYKNVIFIGGNHDNFLDGLLPHKDTRFKVNFEYLCDSGTEFAGFKIWGSPWTKTFKGINLNCKAFTLDTEEELAEKWALIPDDIDILITHSPPLQVFDRNKRKENVGSVSLRRQVFNRIQPKLHVFGHIHESGGMIMDVQTIKFVNASHVDEYYDPINEYVRVEL